LSFCWTGLKNLVLCLDHASPPSGFFKELAKRLSSRFLLYFLNILSTSWTKIEQDVRYFFIWKTMAKADAIFFIVDG